MITAFSILTLSHHLHLGFTSGSLDNGRSKQLYNVGQFFPDYKEQYLRRH
jgi:hypothetical protein